LKIQILVVEDSHCITSIAVSSNDLACKHGSVRKRVSE
jgi:hypothetical protein